MIIDASVISSSVLIFIFYSFPPTIRWRKAVFHTHTCISNRDICIKWVKTQTEIENIEISAF